MRLAVRHVTRYVYQPVAERCALRLKLYPSTFDAQSVTQWSVKVNGAEVAPLLTNGFGDHESLWTSVQPQETVEIEAEGVIQTRDAAGVVIGLHDMAKPTVFLRSTPLTQPGERVTKLARGAKQDDSLSKLHWLKDAVRDAVDYKPGTTDASTTAEQAMKLGTGVCQDHAHIFIAVSRLLGLPARYVAGYLLPEGTGDAQTHAWAEALVAEVGWIGFDASNRLCPTDRYVRLAAGFDAIDAAPVRGNIAGATTETLAARVDISQTQQ